MYMTNSNTEIASILICGRWEQNGNYWRESVLNFTRAVAGHTTFPEMSVSLEGPGGLTMTFPLSNLAGIVWCRGTLAKPPAWLSDVPASEKTECGAGVMEILFNLLELSELKGRRLLVIDFNESLGVHRRLGDPSAFRRVFIWKSSSSKNMLGIAGEEVSTTMM